MNIKQKTQETIMRSRWPLLAGAILLFQGCASLHQTVFDNIRIGDSSSHVIEVLGSPDAFVPSKNVVGGTNWYYQRRGEVCGFGIQDDTVKNLACQAVPGYRNPAATAAAAMLTGMGNGLTNAAQSSSTNCTTSYYGSTAYTHCN